jgi:hypothetical protein
MNGDTSQQEKDSEGRAKRKSDSYTSPESYVAVFRSEMMSEEAQAGRLSELTSRLSGLDWRKILGVLGVVVLLGLCLLITLGPGRSTLESALTGLAKSPQATEPSPTRSPQPSQTHPPAAQPTATQPRPLTPTATRTNAPASATRQVTPTPALSPTPSQTSGPECVEATSISLADVGKTLCRSSVNVRTECIQFEGEVQQLGQAPVIVFGWTSLPALGRYDIQYLPEAIHGFVG